MASTSVSSIQNSFKYDVFLSFRGEDTRKNFVDHLYQALKQKSIQTYKDDENIKQGKMISDELIKAIEDSKFYIIVFSKNYASSSWCLEELVKIMECRKGFGHTAYPVFYDVEPTEVRKQTGAVGHAFAKHKQEGVAVKWREALKEASDLAGWELKNTLDGREAKFIQKIVQEISLDLRSINFILDEKLIGMETRIRDVVSSLEMDVDDVRMIGIKGMGGIGKTTLARAVFDQISFQFEGLSFVENVREESKSSLSGLKSLQKQVLSDILNDQGVTVSGVHEGRNKMKNTMCARKVLIVLDDVDNTNQLEALAGDPNWFKSGSRIIITTRDEQVLVAHRVSLIHNVNLLSDGEAICLFSRYAFGKEIPVQVSKELSKEVVRYAAGLPLTIKVMGSFLCGQSEPYWIDAIERLKTIPLEATMDRLEISFDGLEKEYKEIFLDVACILKGTEKTYAIRVLESCGFHAQVGLRVLEQKSLITISESGFLGMHDHLEEMGMNIVRRLHPDEPNKHSRLWIDEEIEEILTTGSGTKATKCLLFYSPGFSAEIAVKGLAKMKDLRFIHIDLDDDYYPKSNIAQFDKVSEYLPSSLRFLRWWGFPFWSLPNTFQGKYLVGLQMEESSIVQLWEDGEEEKVLHKLRFLTIKYSKLRTFDLRLAPNLEQLSIYYCGDFEELHMPADHHSKLEYLTLTGSKLTNLHLGNSSNLKKLQIEDCADLVELKMPAESLKLECLDLSRLKLPSFHLGSTPNLEKLILRGCYDLLEFQMPAECLKLEQLDLTNSKLTNLHLGSTPNLKILKLDCCNDLVEFQMPAQCLKLEHFEFSYSKLPTFHLGFTPNLKILKLDGGNGLVEFQMPAQSLKLEHLELTNSKLTNLHLGSTPNLKILIVQGCHDMVEFQMPAECLKLEHLDLTDSKLTNLHLGSTPNLKILKLDRCNDLVEFQMPAQFLKLEHFELSYLKLPTFHLGFTPNLRIDLKLDGGNGWEEFQMPAQSLKLEHLELSYSWLTNFHLGNTPNLKKLKLIHTMLKTIHLGSTPNLEELILQVCDLVELKMPDDSLKLQYFVLSHSKLKTLHLGSTPNLEALLLEGCYDLVELQMPAESPKLEGVDLSHSKLKNLHLGNTPNLETLILAGCNDLVELQMPVESLKLQELNLSHSKLRILDLGLIPNLERLNLVNCYDLVDINAPVGCLRNLSILDLSGCGSFKSFLFDKQLESHKVGSLSELHLIAEPTYVCPLHSDNDSPKFRFECYYKEDPASSFGNIGRLISIGLCACTNLENFSRSICSLRGLRKLTLEGSIPEVPRDLDQLVFLEELIFSSTCIKILPDSICMLNKLKSLEVVSCWLLEKLPEDLGRLQCLEKLMLTDCKVLQDLPNSICKMKSLISLHLNECRRIMELPEEMGCLGCLKELDITCLGISYLPDSICMLNQLKSLEVVSCWLLEKLPEDLGRLQCLEKLTLSDCKVLQDLPNSVCKMKSLVSLHLNECRRIMELPEEMGCLGCLKELDITCLDISYLPSGIFQLKGLRIVGEDQQLQSFGFTSEIQISENKATVTITGAKEKTT